MKVVGIWMTTNDTSNSHGPFRISRSISLQAQFFVPLNAGTIMPFGQIMDSLTQVLLKVMTEYTFKVDPLSIRTLEMIICINVEGFNVSS